MKKTEDDTFKALKRAPISQLVEDWYVLSSKSATTPPFVIFLSQHEYTLDEYLDWYKVQYPNLCNTHD